MPSIINATTTNGVAVSGDNSGEIQLQSNGTTALTVNTNEGIQILNCLGVGNATPSTSGAGITFPATQSASTDANTLDDYEEGTWTPELRFGGGTTGITYASRAGRYVKIGRTVTCNAYLSLSNKGSSTGTAAIHGLPFISANVTNFYQSVSTFWLTAVPTSGQLVNQISPNTAIVELYYYNGGVADRYSVVNEAALNNGSTLYVCITYIAET